MSILYCFPVIASCLSKVDFNLPHVHLASSFRVTIRILPRLWQQKIRVPWLSRNVVCMILSSAILTQYQHVTDRKTHTQTQAHS